MNYGQVVLANSKSGFIPSVIKWLTRSTWSHSLVLTAPFLGLTMAQEAAENGISDILFTDAYTNNPNEGYRIYALNISPEVRDQALEGIAHDLENHYGFMGLPWFIWRAVNLLFGKDIKSQNNWAQNQEFCSQMCVKYITACGLGHVFDGYGKNSVSPQDLQVIMDAHPEYFTVTDQKD